MRRAMVSKGGWWVMLVGEQGGEGREDIGQREGRGEDFWGDV
jgi:hypothetical protein